MINPPKVLKYRIVGKKYDLKRLITCNNMD